jgi:hypothetical protein
VNKRMSVLRASRVSLTSIMRSPGGANSWAT